MKISLLSILFCFSVFNVSVECQTDPLVSVSVLDCGAVPDGKTDCTSVFQKALAPAPA